MRYLSSIATVAVCILLTPITFPPSPAHGQRLKPFKFEKRPRVALVLSGGGAKGIAHIGVLKVIEEAGLDIDIITGTSMGSIVGGLYASGYRAAELEKLVLSIDWDDLLNDEISRRSVSIEEKKSHDKYIGSFQIRRTGIELPKGYKKGQKLTTLLSRLTLHVQHIHDFELLPIPFRCVATDIVTGKAYALKRGYLPDAIRASMAIPSIFTPIEINGHLLVDGGVVRNLPVSDARAMGADIVIAVDVGAPLYKKEELKSFAEIMDQSVSLLGAQSTKKQRDLADILILPDIRGFTSSQFKRGSELIAVGREAALMALPELKALAVEQKRFEPEEKKRPTLREIKKISIARIEVKGLQRVSKNLVLGRLMMHPPAAVTPDELVEAVDRVYASGFFDRVTFRIDPVGGDDTPADDPMVLILDVSETSGIFLKLGISYDSDMNAALLVNTTLRNIAGQGSKISIDARLSQFPGVNLSYFIHTPLRKPGVGIGVATRYDKYVITTYNSGNAVSSYSYHNYGAKAEAQIIPWRQIVVAGGVEKDMASILAQITPDNPKSKDIESLNYYGYIAFDNLDRTFYPRSGLQIHGEVKYLTDDIGMIKSRQRYDSFMKYRAKIFGYAPLHRRFTAWLGLSAGFTVAKEPYYVTYDALSGISNPLSGVKIYRRIIPFIYENYLGGLYIYKDEYFPFPGLNFMQISGKHAITASAGFQIEPWRDLFIVLRGNVGRVKARFMDLFRRQNTSWTIFYGYPMPFRQHLKNDLLYGYGITIGYLSIIGPIEATLMRGSESNRFKFNVCLGYRIQ